MNRRTGKSMLCIAPQAAVSGAAFTSNVIDRAGFTRARFFVLLGAVGAALTALKLRHSDSTPTNATTLANPADVTGGVFGTSTGLDGNVSALPAGAAANTMIVVDVDLRNCKRYVQLQAAAGAGNTFVSAMVLLEGADTSPESVSELGVSQALVL